MGKIKRQPVNYAGREDSDKPHGHGGDTIAHARLIRWQRNGDEDAYKVFGSNVFGRLHDDISEMVTVRISHDRATDTYHAHDPECGLIASGTLEQVFATVDRYLVRLLRQAPGLFCDRRKSHHDQSR